MFEHKIADLLQLFAEGGDGSGEAPAAEVTGADTSPAAEETEDLEGDFAKMVGKGGKYADAYQKQMQKSFNKRYAPLKEAEARAQRLDAFAKTIAMRYPGVDASDPDALEEAFLNDTRFHDKRAYETGEDAKSLLEAEKKDLELAKLKAKDKAEKVQKEKEAKAKQFRESLIAQEKELVKEYADFNYDEEIKNPEMRKKLLDGYSLRDAYRSVHYDELMAKAVTDAKTATVNSLASGSARPSEGAAAPSVPSTTKIDYTNMSDKEFMELYNKKFRT